MGKNKNTATEEAKKDSGKTYQVFVSGLPYESTDDDLKTFFADYAESIM